ncbi:hypothetical protein jhhlp_002404 [Lomentospora prolificans]|uniref:non-specific serine/threonine protein kinase n=1 Tax=Lomentospora prolificans TaxID=41688 RepID=A0A2N3NDY6_9PEZI|nr:hypothetical protein jhhlp_002404 [Lomentospora prolificans]
MADTPSPQDAGDPVKAAPLAISYLRAESAQPMERSMSDNIREEREDLREAAEQTLNVIVDLNLDGTIKWVSPSWVDVVGTQPDAIQGQQLSDIIVSDNKTVFSDVVESMKKDDSRSHRVRFAVALGPLSKLLSLDELEDAGETSPQVIDLEAQGIMVYDGASGGESHTMWMIRPWTAPREIQIEMPTVIVDSLGSGAEVLASYLTQLAESGVDDPELHPPPPPVLCRICERQIPPWWFEKHTDLCLQEHRAEMDVQMAQEGLTEHRHSIVKVLDALEVRRSRTLTGDLSSLLPAAEYKGLPIGPSNSNQSSPSSSSATSRERTGFGHSRGRSFAVRRPQARIVELLVDLCDTAIEISPPAIKESSSQMPGDLRTQSPQSESRISQVMQWQSPSSNTLEQEQGLALLCADTERVAKAKVEAVFRHRRIIEYAERIRIEFALLVQDCIDEALRKAARIAAGRLSDSAEEEEDDLPPMQDDSFFDNSFNDPAALAEALQNVSLNENVSRTRPTSFIESVQSYSPQECPTPTSNMGGFNMVLPTRDSRRDSLRNSQRESLILGSEAGESDGSIRSSSVASRNPPRTDSPISELGGDLRRAASKRRHRRSLILPGTTSPRRQESPSRSNQPSSPLRIQKPRSFPFPSEGFASPEASPMLPNSEFSSPVPIPPPSLHHHRRQSSAALSEFIMKAPPSPRLSAHNAPPQARPAQPSIKDFEIIKPISKGAFGSVYLSKKKSTGEYFAIKVLKKADMVAKNQVGNVKAERAIMMWQGQSEFVAKLYWTFSSKEYLYLVMEYLNGGDCASLIKILGGLSEDWAKKYLGEVILGVEHLHSRDIIHRDLKPDNLLIDQRGHLKLTDFGLSRMGLVGRQQRALKSDNESVPDLLKQGPFARSASITSSRSTSLDLHGSHSPSLTPLIPPGSGDPLSQPSYFNIGSAHPDSRRLTGQRSDSGGSESLVQMMGGFSLNDSEAGSQPQSAKSHVDELSEAASQGSPDMSALQGLSQQGGDMFGKNTPPQSSMMPPPMALFDPEDTNRKFVGTPDYLAPETIKGEKQNETSDWWSVGCIMFEFLFGIPPFHDNEAELVFENILARKIRWPDDTECEPVSEEAKDLINKLLCMDPNERLGANREGKFASGGEEIRSHPWFSDVNWDTLLEDEAKFVPQTENPEDTEYFDARGATLQSFAEEMEDQSSPPSSAAGSDYPERPHDALSRVRSQVNSIKRGLMPLHIPPHVRDHKSRRLSEPVATDDFGNFSFKNLPVLEKANKDVIQKLRAEALASQNKQAAASQIAAMGATSPGPSLEGSPNMANGPIQRTLSNAKASARPQSPSGISHANSSPNRMSQPSSPLLVSFVANQGSDGRRKVSSTSSSLSQQSGLALPPFENVSRVPPSLQKAATVAASSPIKARGAAPPPLALSPQKGMSTPRQASGSSGTRSRSLTVGSQSQEGSPIASESLVQRHNRRSQVFDMSPSSSDNEGEKHNALLRVQRRRQSSRRLSQIAVEGTLVFRPLDVLICEDHPVSRMVMEKLLEKLRCRTISVPNGSEAVRYSTSEIKFDIIFLEYKLPRINGADVARMIRETKNANSHTPIVAITAYLKELQAPHYFDSLIEKPISSSKLTEVLRSLCQWKPPTPSQSVSLSIAHPHPTPTALRQTSLRLEDSPTSSSSIFAGRLSGSLISSSREQSISSSLYGDSESISTDDVPVVVSRKPTGEWEEGGGGLGIREDGIMVPEATKPIPQLITQHSAPGQLEVSRGPMDKLKARRESAEKRYSEGSTESADDEDEELGLAREKPFRAKATLPSSKLGIEMMRADSHDSVTFGSESTIEPATQVVTPSHELDVPPLSPREPKEAQTPPDSGVGREGSGLGISVEETPRPNPSIKQDAEDEEPTPRPVLKTG